MEDHGERITRTEAELQHMRQDFARVVEELKGLRADIKEMQKENSEVKAILNQAKGGWRVTMIYGGIAATLGAAATFILKMIYGGAIH